MIRHLFWHCIALYGRTVRLAPRRRGVEAAANARVCCAVPGVARGVPATATHNNPSPHRTCDVNRVWQPSMIGMIGSSQRVRGN